MSVKIEGLSLSELKALNVRVEAAIVAAKIREREAARAEIAALAANRGFKIAELFDAKRTLKSTAKFRDKKTGVEWGGRGRYPLGFNRLRAERISA